MQQGVHFFIKSTLVILSVLMSNICWSAGVWQETFAELNLDNWSYVLHPQGINILPKPAGLNLINSESISDITSEPSSNYGALLTIKGEQSYLWRGIEALNRVELQHKPTHTRPGQTTTVSWQFLLPQLFSEDTHQIAYWESDKTYRQSYRLQLNGSRMSLVSNIAKSVFIDGEAAQPNTKQALWYLDDIKANTWYTVTLETYWSMTEGRIMMAINNLPQVHLTLQTLVAHDENMFIQLGILRERADRVESIWLDNVKVDHF
ncbi:heparin lyase I family protein [Shewanella sp. 1_MG-2023]|uniref:heparin lyase I family protein n=1 Tax=unclassified Shewanella TaxID=196818 RepID=UPI0026E34DC1|nr:MULTISPECIES: heparin lyase I family protein [unclassified Shewanella]MDO6613627.1 heparin lyase I family protein [Shewanella sp. 7_MG-2023]MDO6773402.1 heparin lyase I family protein [Shewanella sp. 2_MG-2023]MDO6796277.1 heparin lyase I family protein [Shewanella sp. 1_MG-2023]